MDLMIRRAAPADASEILEFIRQVGSETDNLSFGAEGLPFTPEAEAAYICQIENSCDEIMLIAKVDGKIVGTASLSRLPRRMGHRGDFSVTVLKQYWNQGVGSQLMCQILALAKKHSFEIIDLQVRSDHTQAIHLYEKYGFRKIGTHPCFLKVDNQEIPFDLMCLKLQ